MVHVCLLSTLCPSGANILSPFHPLLSPSPSSHFSSLCLLILAFCPWGANEISFVPRSWSWSVLCWFPGTLSNVVLSPSTWARLEKLRQLAVTCPLVCDSVTRRANNSAGGIPLKRHPSFISGSIWVFLFFFFFLLVFLPSQNFSVWPWLSFYLL